MRDGIELVRQGHPVLVVVQRVFEAAAHAQAASLGVPDLPIHAIPDPRPGVEPRDAAAADATIDALRTALLRSPAGER